MILCLNRSTINTKDTVPTPSFLITGDSPRYCLEATSETRLESVHNLEDAYRLATEIESSETNAIFSFIIANFSTDELVKSQNFLRVQLEKHATKLEREFPLPYKSRLNRQNLSANKPTI